MGCGGSKEDVATGNTVSYRRLLRKKSGVVKTESTLSDIPETDVNPTDNGVKPITEKAEIATGIEEPPVLVTDVKEMTINIEGIKVAEEGKLITKDSPDRYFSSRKDEDSVEAVVVGGTRGEGSEYDSPVLEPKDKEVEKVEVGNGSELEGNKKIEGVDGAVRVSFEPKDGEKSEAAEEAEKGLVDRGGAEVGPKEEDGKTSSKDSIVLKETIVVEEPNLKETNGAVKNLREAEIVN